MFTELMLFAKIPKGNAHFFINDVMLKIKMIAVNVSGGSPVHYPARACASKGLCDRQESITLKQRSVQLPA